jgi:hypothetical protein
MESTEHEIISNSIEKSYMTRHFVSFRVFESLYIDARAAPTSLMRV